MRYAIRDQENGSRSLSLTRDGSLSVTNAQWCPLPSYDKGCTTRTAAESPLCHRRHGHAAPLVDRLQDRLCNCDRPHAVLTVWKQAALAVQLALEGQDLQLVDRAGRERLFGHTRTVAHADHVLRGEA